MKNRIKVDIKSILFLILLLSIGTVICMQTSSAATIYVNNATGDDAHDGLSPTYNGTSGPKLTIKDAVNTVNVGGTVHIADGRYTGDDNRYVDIDHNMIIAGESQDGTIIDAQGIGQIFNIDSGVTITLENLTLKNGNDIYGGAVFNFGTLVVKNCMFTGNTATWGGAITNSFDCNLNVSDSTFIGNTADNGEGGALWNGDGGTLNVINCGFIYNKVTGGPGGAIINYGSSTVVDSFFVGNTAPNGNGSAIWNSVDSTLAASNSTFKGNTADNEGTLYNDQGSLNIGGCSFRDNCASNGGAIFNNFGEVNVTDAYFTNNTAANGGGALNILGYVEVKGCTFTNNTSHGNGGAIYCGNDGNLEVTDSAFTGNTANGDGGAIYNEENLNVTGSTFTGNTAAGGNGGAISNIGTCTVNFNRIISNMAIGRGNAIYGGQGSADARYNWWGSNTSPTGKVYGAVNITPLVNT